MAPGNGFFLLMLLAITWTFADARVPSAYRILGVSSFPRGVSKIRAALERSEQLCTLCEEYSSLATSYLNDNKTQTEIIETLHQACSRLHSYEQQCVILVDYYAQFFFTEAGKIQPKEFCRKVNLCESISLSLPERDDTCTLCHQIVREIVSKLEDPDSQEQIFRMILRECDKIEHYGQECKRLVYWYGPFILANGEKFLQSTDICASIHVCKANGKDAGPAVRAESSVLDA